MRLRWEQDVAMSLWIGRYELYDWLCI